MAGELIFFKTALEGIFGSDLLVMFFILLAVTILLLVIEAPKQIIAGLDFIIVGIFIWAGIPAWVFVVLGIIVAVAFIKVMIDVFFSR